MIRTTGNGVRANCSIWKHNMWVCTRGWVGLMGNIDFPLQSIAATRLLKHSLLPLCSKAESHLQPWGKDRLNNNCFCLFCSWQHGKSKLWGKKEKTNTCLPIWGLFFWPVGWAELIASSSEESWLQWKLQCWCQEIQSFTTWNDQKRFFSHWRLLASSPKVTQDLKVQADFLKWQDYINLCLKGNRNGSTSSAIGTSLIVSYWVQPNRIKCLVFSLLRAVHLVDKGR